MNILNYVFRVNFQGGLFNYLYQVLKNCDRDDKIFIISQNQISDKDNKLIRTEYKNQIFEGIIDLDENNSRTYDRLLKFIEEKKIDIIIFHYYLPAEILRKLSKRVPIIYFLHNYSLTCISKLKLFRYPRLRTCRKPLNSMCYLNYYPYRCAGRSNSISVRAMKEKLNSFSGFIVTSNYMHEHLMSNGIIDERIKKNNLFPSIDSNAPGESQNFKEEIDILYIGRFVKEKGIYLFLKNFSDSSLRLHLVGSGYYENTVRKILGDKFKNSEISSWVYDKDQLANLYTKAKVVIVPSIYPEPFGLVGLEAMLFRKPVAAFNVGGIGEWLKNGVNGYLIPEGNWKMFNRKVQYLLHNPEVRRKFGEAGYRIYNEKFRPERHYKKLIEDLKYFKSKWK